MAFPCMQKEKWWWKDIFVSAVREANISNQSCTQSLYRTLSVVYILMRFYRDVTSSVLLFLPIIITSRLYRIYEHENQRSQMYPINFTCVMQNSAEVENVQGSLLFKESLFANEHLFCMFALLCCEEERTEQNLLKFKNVRLGCCINRLVISYWSATTLTSLSVSVCDILLVLAHLVDSYMASFLMS